jgi:glycosyltransferase involved in cell wall biosynthesis
MAPSGVPSSFSPRALHVVGYLHGNDGITTHLMALSDGIRRRGGAVGVASCVRSAPAYHVEARGADWYAAQGVPRFFVPFPDPQRPDRQSFDGLRALRGLYDAVQEFRPDVLHLHSLSLLPYVWAVRRLTGVPTVSTLHLEPDPQRTGVRLLGAANRLFPLRPDGLIALCREQEAFFRSTLHARPEQIFRIPHGIDPAHFRPAQPSERAAARARFGLSPEEPTVAMVGRLDHVKGHDVLIRALARLQREGRSVTALFAGTGAGEDAIRRQVAENSLSEAVRFLGFADSREVLWASDVSVLPSRREAFPLVTLEAMLCGVVPIRTPASGAYDQILDGETGFLIPFDDDRALADRLERLVAQPDLQAAMAGAALRWARTHFTADVMIDRTLAAYAAVVGRGLAAAVLETDASSLGVPVPSSVPG